MAGRRILYGAALAAALAFQIFYDGYLAQFLLLCVIVLPLLSLALSLPGMLRLRLTLSACAPRLLQGARGQWLTAADSAGLLPAARLKLTLRFRNALTGREHRGEMVCQGLERRQTRSFPMASEHCGALSCQVLRARAYDLLGLFALPLTPPRPAQALIFPHPAPEDDVPGLARFLTRLTAAPGRLLRGEDYEIRDYQPGDPIRDIHWKLSAKRDGLVIREKLKTGRPQAILTLELSGAPERLDRVLSHLWTVSTRLSGQGWPHQVRWTDEAGRPRSFTVSSQRELEACTALLLSQPAPAHPPQKEPEAPEPGIPHLTITGGEGEHAL